ncbi:MAG: DUF2079 domain-containing protein, partial [Candidatus Marinimicrobia bacterium]|nr:DUF2079 domain-containing protein [Candidatus Neomarinimicrobiota bacterium]
MSRLTKLLIIWLTVLALLYSTLSIVRHAHFQSGGFDLGLYDQTIWKYSHFLSPYNTIKDRFALGDHLNLTLPLIAPLYWLWEDVRLLLIFQAFWLSFSSLAIYLLCRLRKFSPLTSFNLSFLYSLFYGIQFAVFFDFHPVIIGVGLIAWLVYFLESKRKKLFGLTLVLLLLTQENMGLALTSLGLIYFFKKDYRGLAIGFIFGGLVWSLLAAKIIAFFSPEMGFQYWPTISHDPGQIIQAFFNAQEKRLVWLYSFSWFSFLPLLSPGAVLAVAFELAQYFVTGPEFARMWSPFMHHRAILAPFLLLGTLDALRLLEKMKPPPRFWGRLLFCPFHAFEKIKTPIIAFRWCRLLTSHLCPPKFRGTAPRSNFRPQLDAVVMKKKWFKPQIVTLLMVLVALGLQYGFHFPLNKLSKRIYWQSEHWMADNRALFQVIPPDASLATQQSLIPHLSQRREIYLTWPREHDFDESVCGQRSCWWLDFGGQPEYLVVDLHPYQWLTQLLET